MKANQDIDVVITWVDGSDPQWLDLKRSFSTRAMDQDPFVAGDNRFADNGLLRFLFRGIESFMPWVRKVHFVTYGHLPIWLNKQCDKLHIVRHDEFINSMYLPTFNSNVILLNMHRIPDLADRFIYFNDDMFVIRPCGPSIFFKYGLPCDMAVMNPVVAPDLDPFWDMMLNNVMVINRAFEKKRSIRRKPFKWYSLNYGFKNLFRNAFCSGYHFFPGFYDCHLPNAYLKSEFEDFWLKNTEICEETCRHKFRNSEDITEWAVRYWQLAKGCFYPINKCALGEYVSLRDDSSNAFLWRRKGKLICLNDECSGEKLAKFVNAFEKLLPETSRFEVQQ